MEQQTVNIKNFLRITKIVQVSAMKVHFQIAERSLFYLNPYIHYRRMTYPLERMIRKEKSPSTRTPSPRYSDSQFYVLILPVLCTKTVSFNT